MERGRLSVVTPATAWPVTLDDIKRDLHVGDGSDDAQLQGYLSAALGWLQPPDGYLGRSIAEQTLTLGLSCWFGERMLPAGPVTEIVSLKYYDTANVEQTVAADQYWLDGDFIEISHTFMRPALWDRRSAVKVTYKAGGGECPAAIKTAIGMLVKEMYDAPGGFVVGQSVAELPTSAAALLITNRKWW